MDKKAWTAITLCLVLMGVNFWFSTQNIEKAKQEAAAKAAAAPASAVSKPAEGAPPVPPPAAATVTPAAPLTSAANLPEEKHELKVGTVTYQFSTRGGGVTRAILAGHDKVELNKHGREPIGALRREATSTDLTPYKILEKDDTHIVFQGVTAEGAQITKTYSLTTGPKSDEHLLALTLDIKNTGAAQLVSSEYYLYAGVAASLRPDEIIYPGLFWNNAGDEDQHDVNYFKGGMMSSEKSEFRGSYDRLRWGGVMDRFYAHIISTKEGVDQPGKIWATRQLVDHTGDEFKDMKGATSDYGVQGAVGLPPIDLAPGASKTLDYEIYLGPKEYHRLREIGWQRSYVMFYGWFTVVSRVLTNIMRWMHDFTGSWGLAIILLTIIVRTCLWPVHAKSQSTMKRMALLGPKMKELQEKYKDDQAKQSAEVMKLYRDYGVNPLGGCLPMFIQIPIFFGFYRVLQYAAELRGQGFLWVQDLSAADTVAQVGGFDINPLPLIMGVTMFLQMKLTPQPQTTDKMQQRIFMLMPFFFLFFCYSFAAALSLYWSTQNIFSIFQAWITKLTSKEATLEKIDRGPKGGAPAAPSMFSPGGGKEKKNKKGPPRLGG
jgi:YidC/Oxa1 family membrane protein insertase